MTDSDYRNTWEGERSEAVREIEITEEAMPETPNSEGPTERFLSRPEEDERHAERHTHDWSVEEPT
jgi:hypothetical protein